LLFSNPTYGGTDHFIHHFLTKIGVHVLGFNPFDSKEEILAKIEKSGHADKLAMIYVETPANPTNDLIDLKMVQELSKEFSTDDKKVLIAVDNTYMGPLWQHPLELGADLIIYSATKYIGGHSDVIAGAVLGYKDLMGRVKTLRTFLGNMAGPWTGWLLMRSLETLKIRMEKQQSNAVEVAAFLEAHPKVRKVNYLGLIKEGTKEYDTFKNQCKGTGAMLSFEVKGGEKEAFKFLNGLKLIKLAVSLGSTESLAEHPCTMTHAGVDDDSKLKLGITESLVRISVGVEHPSDIIWDIENALNCF
jgi:methionine-gamma-lyase